MQPSTGIRIIDESWDNRRYVLTVEGKCGVSYSIILIDPDSTISSVQNAEIRGNVNGRVSLRVIFNEKPGEEEYQRKTIVCTT
jgi:hypothetical protein